MAEQGAPTGNIAQSKQKAADRAEVERQDAVRVMGVFDTPPMETQAATAALPHNVEAEGYLLGALMMNNAAFHTIPYLSPEHFFEPIHERIFSAIGAKSQCGEVANPITLRQEFEQDDRLREIGGMGYLGKLASLAASVYDVRDYAMEVYRTANKRQMIEWCAEATGRLNDGSDGSQAEEVAAWLSSRLNELNAVASSMMTKNDRQITQEILEGLKSRPKPYSTGIAKLDKAMDGGLHPGKMYGFVARKKVGKTVLASTLSCNLNLAGLKHLFICGEMGPHEIQERNLARLTGYYPSAFRGDMRHNAEFQLRVADAAAKSNRCIIYQNAPGLTFDKLRQYVAAAVHKHRITGVILDYWQLVGGKARSHSTAEHLDAVAQWMADSGRQYGIWSVVTAQANQEGNTRGGEGLRLACDQAYQIHRDDVTKPDTWLEMMDTRYTCWTNIGDENEPGLLMKDKGPYFEEA